jgi:hypothetical protein
MQSRFVGVWNQAGTAAVLSRFDAVQLCNSCAKNKVHSGGDSRQDEQKNKFN